MKKKCDVIMLSVVYVCWCTCHWHFYSMSIRLIMLWMDLLAVAPVCVYNMPRSMYDVQYNNGNKDINIVLNSPLLLFSLFIIINNNNNTNVLVPIHIQISTRMQPY